MKNHKVRQRRFQQGPKIGHYRCKKINIFRVATRCKLLGKTFFGAKKYVTVVKL